MLEHIKTFLLGALFTALFFGAHELVTMNEKQWCQVQYKQEPKYIAECEVIGKGLARVSFK